MQNVQPVIKKADFYFMYVYIMFQYKSCSRYLISKHNLAKIFTKSETKSYLKMDILPDNFRTLSFCGVWFEFADKDNFFKKIYRFFVAFIIIYFTFTGVLGMILIESEIAELIDIMFLDLTFAALCVKILNLLFYRKKIVKILNQFRNEIFRSKNQEEEKILKNYLSKASKVWKYYLTLSLSTGIIMCTSPVLTVTFENAELPLKTYQFYDDSTKFGFYFTFLIHFFSTVYGICINISFDTMITGFFILLTGQLDLLSFRLLNCMKKEEGSITFKECVIHHRLIKNTVKQVENCFISVIATQFSGSLITLCTSIYRITQVYYKIK